MNSIVLLCTDGSDAAIGALRACRPLLASADRTILVTVQSAVDAHAETGAGFTLDASTTDPNEHIVTDGDRIAMQHLDRTASALELGEDIVLMSVVGHPGKAICELAASLPASVIVMGTSGHGGFRRAFVGSTSDHVIRNATCPVLVQTVGR